MLLLGLGGPAAAEPYPVAWWPLDDGVNPTGEIVRGLVSTLTSNNTTDGPKWVIKNLSAKPLAPIDCNRDALRFDGSDAFVSVPDTTSGQMDGFTALTLSAWIRPAGPSSPDGGAIVSKYDTHNAWLSYHIGRMPGSGGNLRFILGQRKFPTETYIAADTTDLVAPAGVWTHVAAVWTGSNAVTDLRIYVNGVSAQLTYLQSGTFTGMYRGSVPIEIGSSHSATGSFVGRTAFFHGDIDDVRIYDVALTAAEVAALAAGGAAVDACPTCPIDCGLPGQQVYYGVVRRSSGALGSIHCWTTTAGGVDCRRDAQGELLVGPPECAPP